MERNSTNENFEHFLRQNAEDYRMYPSDKVWDGISKNLRRPKRRYFGFFLLLVSSSLIGYSVYEVGFNPTKPGKSSLSTPETKNTQKAKADAGLDLSNRANVIPDNRTSANQLNKSSLAVTTKTSSTASIVTKTSISAAEQMPEPIAEVVKSKDKWTAKLLTADKLTVLPQISGLAQKPSVHFNEQDLVSNATKQGSKAHKKNSRFDLMFYFTPTVSYRKLTENKSYLRSSTVGAPYSYAALYDINNAVTHKPDIGLEFGASTRYALTKNIKLRAGVQFNINRYDIKAFKYVPEVATIALNNGYRVDSVNTLSNYRNLNGASPDWLENFYFQVSTPIGVEVTLPGNGKTRFGVASTIQPTYVLGDRAYMITADYKNYAQVPWLIRRWNVNTNLETFIAYSSGKLNWQIGPQVRYQLLSSFVSKYPVKENLFDFGLKVGISINQNK